MRQFNVLCSFPPSKFGRLACNVWVAAAPASIGIPSSSIGLQSTHSVLLLTLQQSYGQVVDWETTLVNQSKQDILKKTELRWLFYAAHIFFMLIWCLSLGMERRKLPQWEKATSSRSAGEWISISVPRLLSQTSGCCELLSQNFDLNVIMPNIAMCNIRQNWTTLLSQ